MPFDLFKLPDERQELRTMLRSLCEKEIAPRAAEVDALIGRVVAWGGPRSSEV